MGCVGGVCMPLKNKIADCSLIIKAEKNYHVEYLKNHY